MAIGWGAGILFFYEFNLFCEFNLFSMSLNLFMSSVKSMKSTSTEKPTGSAIAAQGLATQSVFGQ